MFTVTDFDNIIYHELSYKQRMVYAIDEIGREHSSDSILETQNYIKLNYSIKLEQLEKYSQPLYEFCKSIASLYGHNGPTTCHAFKASKDSYTFPLHTDPDDVVLYGIDGCLQLELDGKLCQVGVGETLIIPADVSHRAVNMSDSLILSIGLEKFLKEKMKTYYELDVLPKNDRNL